MLGWDFDFDEMEVEDEIGRFIQDMREADFEEELIRCINLEGLDVDEDSLTEEQKMLIRKICELLSDFSDERFRKVARHNTDTWDRVVYFAILVNDKKFWKKVCANKLEE